jgi:hypothetical protein
MMSRQFEIRREVVLPATPEQVFTAVTEDSAAWMFPVGSPEPRVGGAGAFGSTVTAWDPPNHFAVRGEGQDGSFNALEYLIEARDGGTAVLRYVHSGVFVDDWDSQYDGADQHTDFYLRTLSQYLRHFFGRPVTYVSAQGPATSSTPGSFDVLKRGLGLPETAAEGDAVNVDVPGVGRLDAVVDYLTPVFLGLRTDDALYRFYGRDAFGSTVEAAHHLFGAGVDQDKTQHAWQVWIDGVYA